MIVNALDDQTIAHRPVDLAWRGIVKMTFPATLGASVAAHPLPQVPTLSSIRVAWYFSSRING